MKKKFPIPSPIFDGLEHLSHESISSLPSPFGKKDYQSGVNFLTQYNGNQATFDSYRREIERLFQWAWYIHESSVLSLKRQDIENYLAFCLTPPKSWIAIKRVARFITKDGERIPNPVWRPFVAQVSKHDHKKGITPEKKAYQLSQKAVREIFTVLSSFYHYLALEEKVKINPVALIRQKSKYLQKRQQQAPVMRLSDIQWKTCLECVKTMADSEPDKHERTLFLISSLYLLYLRISELVASDRWIPQMGHFYQDSLKNWWFKTVGKGNKLREIAVPDDMIKTLTRYRKSLGLSALPSPNDKTPLLPKEKGKGAMASSRHIRRLVQNCFDMAITTLRESGNKTDADALESATVHWLRHTGISDDINVRGRPVAHVRDDAGHSSSAITDRYNNVNLSERNRSAKSKKLG